MKIDDLKKSFFGYQKASVCRLVDELEKTRTAQNLKTKETITAYSQEIVELKRQLFDCKAENEQLRKELAKQKEVTQQEELLMEEQINMEHYLKDEETLDLTGEEHNFTLFEKQEPLVWKK